MSHLPHRLYATPQAQLGDFAFNEDVARVPRHDQALGAGLPSLIVEQLRAGRTLRPTAEHLV